ncbi:Co/Zn/Cd efflux system component [Methylorubrum zatmanii]|nr:Co/Zn/Cd efflux system component [Methylorubrum zatmanii]MCP1553960.1 Co/Zn/Cd efflux system component [Methylorubrum extorquens]MCP1579729.1 Co/Zn/Cd efflux system component [Methylorubrum extorquens]
MSLAAVPTGIDPSAVRSHLEALPGVTKLHGLHIWQMSTTEVCVTAHLVTAGEHPGDAFLMEAANGMLERFGIGPITLQVETGSGTSCSLAPAEVV